MQLPSLNISAENDRLIWPVVAGCGRLWPMVASLAGMSWITSLSSFASMPSLLNSRIFTSQGCEGPPSMRKKKVPPISLG